MFAVDAGSTQGVAQVMEQFGLHEQGVKAGGYDLLPEILKLMRAKHIDFTIDQQPYLQGFFPVMQLYLYNISGGVTGPAETNTGLIFITPDTVDRYLETESRFEGDSGAAEDRAGARVERGRNLSETTTARETPGAGTQERGLVGRLLVGLVRVREASVFLVLVGLVIYFQAANPAFLSEQNILSLAQFAVPYVVIAAALCMLLICGEIDLSVGQSFAFAPIVMYLAYEQLYPVSAARGPGGAARRRARRARERPDHGLPRRVVAHHDARDVLPARWSERHPHRRLPRDPAGDELRHPGPRENTPGPGPSGPYSSWPSSSSFSRAPGGGSTPTRRVATRSGRGRRA